VQGFLIVNPRSGDGGTNELVAAAHSRGIETHTLRDGDDLLALARTASSEVLGMAGGDGSLAAVADVAVERDLPFVCVPFGTRNHFARDVGLDRTDPVAALAAFGDGVEQSVDIGRANDRLFLNNVSLGVYARVVHRREHHRRRSDAFARLRALAIVAAERHPAQLTVDGVPLRARVVVVSNNRYELTMLSIGERERMNEGRLHLYAPLGVLRSSWAERSAEHFRIDAGGASLRAAIDGEPVTLETPVEFRIQPGALRLRLPRDPLGQHEVLPRERQLG
jgi:diacylglycerol kinase family enzyme